MVLIKRGSMFKQGSGDGLFQRRNWKKRYFELTQEDLRYFQHEHGPMKGCLDLSSCTKDSLEMVPTKMSKDPPTTWCLAITTPSRRFFMSMASETEMHAWAFAFLEAFKMNEDGGRKTYTAEGQLRGFVKEQKVKKQSNLSKLKMTPRNHKT
ncbi:hypothetical protein H257_18862 [Aphanomyces astaci]|uniref:PH domain-containing protein n=1 Tax=Aphanomyces astaci TaxID=112090 RepID=W4FBN4_APHAT|nr:hypothetical protein H257_18862 [Aphanomyces astaci]ETV64221.1 hypothetical protein H257_18862 [Aphanomyces astaci]RQM21960.1 hypothetical protein B5M09_009255 [Aphanomyces astaci]|eukprot:XP_009846295.1 hypothetical protein H257_18862 [Aphanomyces astaci]